MFSTDWSEIRDLETSIRDFVTEARRREELVARRADWNMLVSSLDAIGDTELAIEAYTTHPEPSDDGQKYLLIYGILQTLFLQQDAVQHTIDSLQLQYDTRRDFHDIRQIRNKTAGHMTKLDRPKSLPQSSHHISRASMHGGYFQLLSTYEDGSVEFSSVSIRDLISKQRRAVKRILGQVVRALKEDEMAHRERFKDRRLLDIFSTTGYFLEKILMASHPNPSVDLPEAKSSLAAIGDHIAQFKQALEERGILPAYDSTAYTLNELVYPLQRLTDYFDSTSVLDVEAAYIFAFFVRAKVGELQTIAKQIDEEYAQSL
jgi:hypothetical protein